MTPLTQERIYELIKGELPAAYPSNPDDIEKAAKEVLSVHLESIRELEDANKNLMDLGKVYANTVQQLEDENKKMKVNLELEQSNHSNTRIEWCKRIEEIDELKREPKEMLEWMISVGLIGLVYSLENTLHEWGIEKEKRSKAINS